MNRWSDCFGLRVLYGWLLFVVLAGGLLLVAECTPAHAGQWYAEGGVGGAFFQNTVDDGTWRQDKVQEPNTRLFDQAWKVGLGYRINPLWSVQGHYFDWGSNVTKSLFASDEAYYGGKCPGPDCPTFYNRVEDRMWGYDLTVTRHFPLQDSQWEPYLKAGGAVAFHELKWAGSNGVFGPTRLNGAIPMLTVGGGLCWDRLCWDNQFYTGTLSMNGGCLNGGQYDCGYPLAKQVAVSMLVFRVHLPH